MLPETEIANFTTSVPQGIVEELREKAEAAITTTGTLKERKIELPAGTEMLLEEILTALDEGRYAWARRALNSYPILKVTQLRDQ